MRAVDQALEIDPRDQGELEREPEPKRPLGDDMARDHHPRMNRFDVGREDGEQEEDQPPARRDASSRK